VDEQHRLLIPLSATDADVPAQHLTFALTGVVPAGAGIVSNRVFRWRPSEAQGPGAYPITLRVTDDGQPPLSDTNTFTVTVRDVNSPPWFSNTTEKHVKAGQRLAFWTGFDSDWPAQLLTFTLGEGAPAGATLDRATGEFAWVPTDAQAPGAYFIDVGATDNGVPALASSHRYSIHVYERNAVVMALQVTRLANVVRLLWNATPGQRYQVDSKESLDAAWQPFGPPVVPTTDTATFEDTLQPGVNRWYRVRWLE
jgi:hypothetical protein